MPGSYHSVNALARGLAILKALSRLGESSTAALAENTGIPRPSVHRLLETLREEGYVQRAHLRENFRLTAAIQALGQGYDADDWINEVAGPILAKLRAEVVWPTDISTYMHGAMVVRATTHSNNPLSIERVTSGRQLRMLATATGLCYLAFCQPAEQNAILETVYAAGLPEDEKTSASALDRELKQTKERGYGIRIKGKVAPKTSSIAVPILHEAKVLACINIVWIHSAIPLQTAVDRYLKPLKKAASHIEADYHRYVSGKPPARRR